MKYTDFKKLKVKHDVSVLEKYKEKGIVKVKDKRTRFNNDLYEIYPIAITDKKIYIVCPDCGEIHGHGSCGGNYDGYLTPHCKGEKHLKTYRIKQL